MPNVKGTIRTGRRSRAVALLLLGLFAHAILVCAFHHHSENRGDDFGSGLRIVSDCGSHSEHVPVSNENSKCLSCRLQSHFLSAVRSPAWTFTLAVGTTVFEPARPEPRSHRTSLVLSDRAPPVA